MMNDLQNRELSDSDYTTLISLDEGQNDSVSKHLMNALSPILLSSFAGGNSEYDCAVCKIAMSAKSRARILPCTMKHLVHESCALGILSEAQMSGRWGVAGAICPCCNDDRWLFPSLMSRKPLEKSADRKVSKNKENPPAIKKQINSVDSLRNSSCGSVAFDECIVGQSKMSLQERPFLSATNSITSKSFVRTRQRENILTQVREQDETDVSHSSDAIIVIGSKGCFTSS